MLVQIVCKPLNKTHQKFRTISELDCDNALIVGEGKRRYPQNPSLAKGAVHFAFEPQRLDFGLKHLVGDIPLSVTLRNRYYEDVE